MTGESRQDEDDSYTEKQDNIVIRSVVDTVKFLGAAAFWLTVAGLTIVGGNVTYDHFFPYETRTDQYRSCVHTECEGLYTSSRMLDVEDGKKFYEGLAPLVDQLADSADRFVESNSKLNGMSRGYSSISGNFRDRQTGEVHGYFVMVSTLPTYQKEFDPAEYERQKRARTGRRWGW